MQFSRFQDEILKNLSGWRVSLTEIIRKNYHNGWYLLELPNNFFDLFLVSCFKLSLFRPFSVFFGLFLVSFFGFGNFLTDFITSAILFRSVSAGRESSKKNRFVEKKLDCFFSCHNIWKKRNNKSSLVRCNIQSFHNLELSQPHANRLSYIVLQCWKKPE